MSGQHADAAGLRLLVVGASSGIGHAVAVSAAERGAKVAVAARRMDLLTQLADAIGGTAFELDVEDPAAITGVVGAASAALGGLDAVVFTSTVVPFAHIEDTDWPPGCMRSASTRSARTTYCGPRSRTCPRTAWCWSRPVTTSAVPRGRRRLRREQGRARRDPALVAQRTPGAVGRARRHRARPRTPRFSAAPTATCCRSCSSRGSSTGNSPRRCPPCATSPTRWCRWSRYGPRESERRAGGRATGSPDQTRGRQHAGRSPTTGEDCPAAGFR